MIAQTFEDAVKAIDKKFLKKLEKVTRYNPDPLSMGEPMNGEPVAPILVAVMKDKHFVRSMQAIGLYNCNLVKFENHTWTFQYRFVDDYRVEINVNKYLSDKQVMLYEDAVENSLKEAVWTHFGFLKDKETTKKERVDDIIYE